MNNHALNLNCFTGLRCKEETHQLLHLFHYKYFSNLMVDHIFSFIPNTHINKQ